MKKELWLRLRNYHFDHLVPAHLLDRVAARFGGHDASTQAFAHKIALKHQWSTRRALRSVEEYKKFVYLGVVSSTPVTPPRCIDTVWHEHLLFTRGYREFCRDVLQRDFDHNPELMPVDEQTDVFEAQYDATLALYTHEFNMTPPAAIWGTTKFAADRAPRSLYDAAILMPVHDTDDALYLCFDPAVDACPEFGGGGGFSGGGGGDSWGSDDATAGESSTDAGSSDSGCADGGSSCSGGSGCSSSCGGGGCSSS